MIKKTKAFLDQFEGIVAQVDNIKTSAKLLRKTLEQNGLQKDREEGGALIYSQAEWFEKQGKEMKKTLDEFYATFEAMMKAVMKLREDIPAIVKDCEGYMKQLENIKQLFQSHGYSDTGAYQRPVIVMSSTSFKAIDEKLKALVTLKAQIFNETAK